MAESANDLTQLFANPKSQPPHPIPQILAESAKDLKELFAIWLPAAKAKIEERTAKMGNPAILPSVPSSRYA